MSSPVQLHHAVMQGFRARQNRRAQVHRRAGRGSGTHLLGGRSVWSVVAGAVLGLYSEDVLDSIGQVGLRIGSLSRCAPLRPAVVLAVDPPIDTVSRRGSVAVVGWRVPGQGDLLVSSGGDEVAGRSRWAVGPHGSRGSTCQGLLVAAVVDEGHSDLDGLPLVGGYELVGRVGRLLYIRIGCSVTGYPLVGERFAAQTVGVGNARYVRRQRLAHLRRATDSRRAGGRVVGCRRRPGPHPFRCLACPGLVADAYPVLVLHALFRALIGISGIGAAGVLHEGVVVPGAPVGTLLVGAATLDAVAGDRGSVGRFPGQLDRAALLRDRTHVAWRRRKCRCYRCGRLTGQCLFIARFVGKGHLHLDGLARVAGNEDIGGARSALDFRVPARKPLVTERRSSQSVSVRNPGGGGRQRLSDLGSATDGGSAGGRAIGAGRHRAGCRASQRLSVAFVIGEGHADLDGLARVAGNEDIGGARSALDFRVSAGQPLVTERRSGQSVSVGDTRSFHRQRLSDLGSATDGRSAGGRAIGAGRHRAGCRASQRLSVAFVIGEGHSDLDGLARVAGNEDIGGARSALDFRVPAGQPLVAERRAGQSVGVRNPGGGGRQRLSHLRCAADGGRARGRSVRGSVRGAGDRELVDMTVFAVRPYTDLKDVLTLIQVHLETGRVGIRVGQGVERVACVILVTRDWSAGPRGSRGRL